ncbi:MAG: DsbA family oxidoreductase [Chitinophagaceae bacterium]|nr:DsbA family oxidoreductase [Chitinophagaceae bacterium]
MKQMQIDNLKKENMKVEIWSDVMCPFCYIGKRKFETALAQFEHKDKVEVEWKSFQLMRDLTTKPNQSLAGFLAENKGMSMEEAKDNLAYVSQMAEQIGLKYDMDKAIPANSFNAHRFAHFAKANGKQDEAEEKLFQAYFTEGKNIDDFSTLLSLGKAIGLDSGTLKMALENGSYAGDVRTDVYEAQQIGVRGVPFFVFNRKQAVSGAQESQTFLRVLERSFAEWRKENPEAAPGVIDGQSCASDGKCN